MRQIEKMVLLQTLDHLWREHLVTLEHLRQVIGFRSYGQRDPLNEYKSEGFHLFETMLANLREAVTGQLMHIQGMPEEEPEMQEVELPPMRASHVDPFTGEDELAMADAALSGRPGNGQAERRAPMQTRKAAGNALCPCGSGKKYKHCHGRHD
jgi:preprotein translocase subunit SecA